MDSVLTVGRYGIDEWLASGAMDVVFRGYDPVLDRPVAIKILRREMAMGSAAEKSRERFRRRARAGGRLFHPNIPTVLDFAEDHEVPFIAMEYVDGSSLDRVLNTSGRLAPPRAVAMTLQILDALEYSHENGVIHLDLKPSIVFVLEKDRVKVADFGIALANDGEPTNVGGISETASGMAPEQLTGGLVDHRADLFGAGAMLFEMLTCAKPFRGGGVDELIAEIETRGPKDIRALNPEVSGTLRSVIETALAYDPRQRYATAGEFSRALSRAVSLASGGEPIMRSASAARAPAHQDGWDSDTLQKVESDLAAHIGPVAAVAVRRAAKHANDLVALYEKLAVHIEDDRERDEFLESGGKSPVSDPTAPALPEGALDDPALRGGHPIQSPDPAVLEAIEAKLAQYVGPIARFLVKQQLENFKTMPELYHSLADHISDESERAAFLNWARI